MTEYYLLMVLSVTVASASQVLLKLSAKKKHESFLKEYLNPLVIIAYSMLIISTLMTIAAFKHLPYKNASMLETLGYLIVIVLSRIFLGEKITKAKFLGNLVIVIGLIVFYS